MKIKFNDGIGSKGTIYFNPEVVLFGDGSIIVLETEAYHNGKKFIIPSYIGEPKTIWVDFKRLTYDNNQNNNLPGAFIAIFSDNDSITITRYKEKIVEPTLFQRVAGKIRAKIT